MNNRTRTILSVLWLLLVTIPIIVTVCNLRFPAFDYRRFGQIIIPLFLILPLVSVIYSVAVYKSEKAHKIIDSLLVLGLVFEMICTTICTFGFRNYNNDLYPLVSTTEELENYLVIEKRFEESDRKYILQVFPEKIPEDATETSYYYRCTAFGIYDIKGRWKLPYEKYIFERNRIISNELLYDKSSDVYEYNYSFDIDIYTATVIFNDSDCSISYEFGTIF